MGKNDIQKCIEIIQKVFNEFRKTADLDETLLIDAIEGDLALEIEQTFNIKGETNGEYK